MFTPALILNKLRADKHYIHGLEEFTEIQTVIYEDGFVSVLSSYNKK